jgi:hypothetical protein
MAKEKPVRVLQSPIRKPWVSRRVLIGFAIAFIAAPLAAAPTGGNVLAQAASESLHCEIQKSQSGDMVKLVGIVEGTRAVAGTSRFVMIKSGTSGSSNIAQSQHFALKARQQAVVGQATTNLDPGGHIAIDFGVKTDGGLACNVRASLER